MSEMDELLNVTKADANMQLAKHNETDYSTFNDFHQRMMKRHAEQQAAQRADLRRRAIEVWEEITPPRWRGASLETINNKAARDVKKLIEADGVGNFFIKGVSQAGKTYLAYAVARKYIELGKVRPTKVYVASEADFLSSAKVGYEGINSFNKLLRSGYTMFILDDVGLTEEHKEYTSGEMTQWSRLLDHVYSNSIPIVLTSNGSAANFATNLSKTAEAKFVQLVSGTHLIEMKRDGRIAPDPLEDWTTEEVAENKEKTDLGTMWRGNKRNPNRK